VGTSRRISNLFRRAPFVAAAFAFAALAPAAWAGGPASPRLTVGEGGTLRAGALVRVAWDAVPPDTAEFELLLKIERPAPLKLRLTECQDPATASLVWRVPDLPCGEARLVLRRGERRRETTWAVSETFSIAAAGLIELREASERVTFRDDELWMDVSPSTRPTELDLDRRFTEGGPLQNLPACALRTAEDFAVGPAEDSALYRSSLGILLARPARPVFPRMPLRLPLRI
jgi:hypothetical protein